MPFAMSRPCPAVQRCLQRSGLRPAVRLHRTVCLAFLNDERQPSGRDDIGPAPAEAPGGALPPTTGGPTSGSVFTPAGQEFVKTVAASVTTLAALITLIGWGVGLSSGVAQLNVSLNEMKAAQQGIKTDINAIKAVLLSIAVLLFSPAIARAAQFLGIYRKE
jgi:hypothetical protein